MATLAPNGWDQEIALLRKICHNQGESAGGGGGVTLLRHMTVNLSAEEGPVSVTFSPALTQAPTFVQTYIEAASGVNVASVEAGTVTVNGCTVAYSGIPTDGDILHVIAWYVTP